MIIIESPVASPIESLAASETTVFPLASVITHLYNLPSYVAGAENDYNAVLFPERLVLPHLAPLLLLVCH